MAAFVMFGTYSQESLRQINPKRTQEAAVLIKKCGGEMKDMWALLGDRDLLLVADFADIESAMSASLALSRMTGISFSTCPAIAVDRFDQLAAKA